MPGERIQVGLKPNAELRRSFDEANMCLSFFNDNKFIDYFQSLNEVYLKNEGTIIGPELEIATSINDSKIKEKEVLEIDSGSHGRVVAAIEWKGVGTDNENTFRNINMTLSFYSDTNCFELMLYAQSEMRCGQETEDDSIKIGTSLQRNFYLNSEPILPKHVDDLLLTFTGELCDSGIL